MAHFTDGMTWLNEPPSWAVEAVGPPVSREIH